MKTAQYQAYALANQTTPKTRQIVMLYDGAIRYLRQAREAIEGNRIEERFNLLVKVSEVVMGLQSCLDFEQGGEVAKALYDFYSSMDARVLSIHRTQSVAMCDQLVAELKQMRDVWTNIDQAQSAAAPDAGQGAPMPAAMPLSPPEGEGAPASSGHLGISA